CVPRSARGRARGPAADALRSDEAHVRKKGEPNGLSRRGDWAGPWEHGRHGPNGPFLDSIMSVSSVPSVFPWIPQIPRGPGSSKLQTERPLLTTPTVPSSLTCHSS